MTMIAISSKVCISSPRFRDWGRLIAENPALPPRMLRFPNLARSRVLQRPSVPDKYAMQVFPLLSRL